MQKEWTGRRFWDKRGIYFNKALSATGKKEEKEHLQDVVAR
jgi:hypothetical protein